MAYSCLAVRKVRTTEREGLSMTIEEIRAAYPGAADAVEMGEGIPPDLWEFARLRRWSVRDVVELCAKGPPNRAAVKPGTDVPAVIEQIRHPHFARYVAGKLGAM